MISYIQKNKTISPTVSNNWKASTSPVVVKTSQADIFPIRVAAGADVMGIWREAA
jgi:hypothetical protein